MAEAEWSQSEAAFKRHFDISYEEFGNLIRLLPEDVIEKYKKVHATDEEAAIVWAIDQGKRKGILGEVEDE